MIKSKFLATLAAIGLAMASLVGVAAPAAATQPTDTGATKITVCHAAPADTAANGWVEIDVDDDSIIESAHYEEHDADIIPPIPDILPGGKNWGLTAIAGFEGYTGEEIWNAGCAIPDPVDVCDNLDGDQAEVPDGYYEDDGECFEVEPDLATASLAFTPATCQSGELVNLAGSSISNATWGSVTDPVGTDDYEVTATADSGAEFAGGLAQKTFTGTLDPPLTGEGCDNEPDLATASLVFTPASCFAAQQVDIASSPISNATWGAVTDPPGTDDYDVTATADSGAEFAGGFAVKHFAGELDPQLADDDPQCLETLGPVQPTVSFKQITCDADGSYTLGAALEGDADKVEWTVNGVQHIASGTYAVQSGKVVTIVAVAIAPDVLEFDWVDPDPFAFVDPSGCDLTTLALTGSSAPPWALNAGIGVLVLGAGLMLIRRRQESLFE